MTVSDTHADTIREALHILYAYTSDDANPPGDGRSSTHANGRSALDALLAEIDRERARADQAEAKLAATDEWVTRVSLQSTEAATRADQAEAALERIASPDELTGDGPLEPILADPHGIGERELKARMMIARDALSAGSGGRETTP